MTNAVYPKWKDGLMKDTADCTLTGSGTTGLWVALVDTNTYIYHFSHEFYSSLTGTTGTHQEVTSVTVGVVSPGVVDGNNVTFPAVVAGPACEALVFYRKNTGASGTWRLVCYLDSGITGLPVTPNGGDITINFNAAGIFGL